MYVEQRQFARAEPGSCGKSAATIARLALLAQLVEHLHGKEGVSGSSPEEGFAKRLQRTFLDRFVVDCGEIGTHGRPSSKLAQELDM
jgi:hypothetical protein